MKKFAGSIAFRLLLSTVLVSTTIVSEGSLVHYLFTADRFDDRTVPSQMDEGVFVRTAVSTASSSSEVILAFQLPSGEVQAPAHEPKPMPTLIGKTRTATPET